MNWGEGWGEIPGGSVGPCRHSTASWLPVLFWQLSITGADIIVIIRMSSSGGMNVRNDDEDEDEGMMVHKEFKKRIVRNWVSISTTEARGTVVKNQNVGFAHDVRFNIYSFFIFLPVYFLLWLPRASRLHNTHLCPRVLKILRTIPHRTHLTGRRSDQEESSPSNFTLFLILLQMFLLSNNNRKSYFNDNKLARPVGGDRIIIASGRP